MYRRRIVRIVVVSVLATVLLVYFCNRDVDKTAQDKLYASAATIPFRHVGLLLGTSKSLKSGLENIYYTNRIKATQELIRAGKIKYLVISGDNSTVEYNEPEQMRADLMAAGIDSTIIYLDYAGFRTFDSMVRLREIFSQQSVTVISQPFHNERAIYIASKEGIDAIGYNAKDVSARYGFKVQLREYLARVNLFLDYLVHKEPKFLGPKVNIPV